MLRVRDSGGSSSAARSSCRSSTRKFDSIAAIGWISWSPANSVIELKTVTEFHPIHEAQLLTYLTVERHPSRFAPQLQRAGAEGWHQEHGAPCLSRGARQRPAGGLDVLAARVAADDRLADVTGQGVAERLAAPRRRAAGTGRSGRSRRSGRAGPACRRSGRRAPRRRPRRHSRRRCRRRTA